MEEKTSPWRVPRPRPESSVENGEKKKKCRAPRQKKRPSARRWAMYAPPQSGDNPNVYTPATTFRVMSFNVLADYLVINDSKVEPAKRHQKYKWEYRRDGLVREILAYEPDIVCLQEVDHFEDFFEPKLQKAGFVGVYKRRTGETTHDGCAIFIKKSKCRIVSSHPIEYFVEDDPVLNRHNIALAAVVETIERNSGSTPKRFVVANTHLLFNPGRGEIKIAQLDMLLNFLTTLRQQHNPMLPVLLGGDFNLTPNSAIYHYLSTGELNASGLRRHDISGQNMTKAARKAYLRDENDRSRHYGNGTALGKFNSHRADRGFRDFWPGTVYSHDFDFSSAYAQSPDKRCTGEPKFTIFHTTTKAAVDYIWFTRSSLHCHGVLELIPAGLLFVNGGELPTMDHPSDHISLVADFSLRAPSAS
ncbi:RNA exonuclease ngl2 [Phytophthora boehmeriae]|uniref:RNA exonuclease ngl2 n=1 Tax=Phytophthora boehmeriae TaxID=109152 RepID=A0A8T1WLF9_9STRA|nr:RNA exonuclease ngl2 [Phytophthora boehmeriae]